MEQDDNTSDSPRHLESLRMLLDLANNGSQLGSAMRCKSRGRWNNACTWPGLGLFRRSCRTVARGASRPPSRGHSRGQNARQLVGRAGALVSPQCANSCCWWCFDSAWLTAWRRWESLFLEPVGRGQRQGTAGRASPTRRIRQSLYTTYLVNKQIPKASDISILSIHGPASLP